MFSPFFAAQRCSVCHCWCFWSVWWIEWDFMMFGAVYQFLYNFIIREKIFFITLADIYDVPATINLRREKCNWFSHFSEDRDRDTPSLINNVFSWVRRVAAITYCSVKTNLWAFFGDLFVWIFPHDYLRLASEASITSFTGRYRRLIAIRQASILSTESTRKYRAKCKFPFSTMDHTKSWQKYLFIYVAESFRNHIYPISISCLFQFALLTWRFRSVLMLLSIFDVEFVWKHKYWSGLLLGKLIRQIHISFCYHRKVQCGALHQLNDSLIFFSDHSWRAWVAFYLSLCLAVVRGKH